MSSIINILPFEVISMIIDIIAKQDTRTNTKNTKRKFKSLKACSLTCQALLPLCRAYIFHSIEFHDSSNLTGRSATPRFIKLINTTPEIAQYIRELRYGMRCDEEFPLLASALNHITKLQSLAIYFKGITGDWRSIDATTRSSLLRVMHLPTVVCLDLKNIARFAMDELIPCINLKRLYLEYFRLVEGDKISSEVEMNPPTKPIHLQKLHLAYCTMLSILAMLEQKWADGRPVLDLQELKEVYLDLPNVAQLEISYAGDVTSAVKILSYTRHLKTMEFTVSTNSVDAVSAVSLISPCLTTLKTLSLVINHNSVDSPSNPYLGMCGAFQRIAGKHHIEVIKLRVILHSYTYTAGDEWKELEYVLTSPGWSSLHQVDLYIVALRSADIANQMKTLPNTQFPGLSSSKLIKFNFHVSRT